MKVRIARLLTLTSILVVIAAGFSVSHAQSKNNVSDNTLSEAERDLLKEINQARANPQSYAAHLEKLRPMFSGKQYSAAGKIPLMTEEGWNAVDEAIKFLRATKPLGPLSASRGLSLAALAHVKDQSGSGGTGHRGADSTFIEQRVKPFGNWMGGIGENITYGSDSARERLLTWLIDDGFPSRGHRRRLLSTEYKVAGISCGSHPQFGGMCVVTLAGGFSELMPAATNTKASTTNTKSPSTTSTKSNSKVKSRKM